MKNKRTKPLRFRDLLLSTVLALIAGVVTGGLVFWWFAVTQEATFAHSLLAAMLMGLIGSGFGWLAGLMPFVLRGTDSRDIADATLRVNVDRIARDIHPKV